MVKKDHKSPESKSSLVAIATDKIRDRILDLTLAPGAHLNEATLRDELGISRTPAREALSRLVTEGLVESNAAKGFYVRQIDLRETAYFFDAYMLIERSSATLCRFNHPNFAEDMRRIQSFHNKAVAKNRFLDITKFNSDFHLRIAEATENRFLMDFAVRTHNFARRLAYFVYAYESDDWDYFEDQQARVVDEHDQIVRAIADSNRDALIDVITRHAERHRMRMASFVRGRTNSKFNEIVSWPNAEMDVR